MSDLQVLYLVLAGFYIWECACWLPRGSVGFKSWLGRHWRAVHPGASFGNARGGFILAAPLPPLGTLLTANVFPFSLSPNVALAFVATTVNPGWRPVQTGRFAAWDDIREVRSRGRKLLVNGGEWWTAPSASLARRRAEELSRLAKLDAKERADALRELFESSLDAKAIQDRWEALSALVRPLRWLSNSLVIHLFVLTPLVIWNLGLKWSWLGLLTGLVVLMITTATLFYRAHRALYPDAADERFTFTLTMALSPVNAMRAHDVLSRPALEMFHPLAVASRFLRPEEFRTFARQTLLDLRHPARPVCPSENPALREAEQMSRQWLGEAVERLVRQSGANPDTLCAPPKPAEAACLSYCPRCHTQFTTTAGECADCGGLELRALHAR